MDNNRDISYSFELQGVDEYNKQLLKLRDALAEVQKQQDILNSLQLHMLVKHRHDLDKNDQ